MVGKSVLLFVVFLMLAFPEVSHWMLPDVPTWAVVRAWKTTGPKCTSWSRAYQRLHMWTLTADFELSSTNFTVCEMWCTGIDYWICRVHWFLVTVSCNGQLGLGAGDDLVYMYWICRMDWFLVTVYCKGRLGFLCWRRCAVLGHSWTCSWDFAGLNLGLCSNYKIPWTVVFENSGKNKRKKM